MNEQTSTDVYVVTNTDYPDVGPFVFVDQWDAIHFAAARWPSDDVPGDAVYIEPQTLIGRDLAARMIAEEEADA